MGHIAIKLIPPGLTNPDLDIRYELPDFIGESTAGRIRDDGYDYVDGDTLIVFLACDNPSSDVQDVLSALAANMICDNRILDSAVIGISDDATTFTIVYPPTTGGEFRVRPW